MLIQESDNLGAAEVILPSQAVHHGHAALGYTRDVRYKPPVVAGSDSKRDALGLWEIVAFGLVCSADMISTVYWYLHGQAKEANPLLGFWLQRSVTAFCIAKLLSFVPMLVVCFIYRRRYPQLITVGLRVALVAYVAIYAVCVGAQWFSR